MALVAVCRHVYLCALCFCARLTEAWPVVRGERCHGALAQTTSSLLAPSLEAKLLPVVLYQI